MVLLGLVGAGIALSAGAVGAIAITRASGWNEMSNRVVFMRCAAELAGIITACVIVGLTLRQDTSILLATVVVAGLAPIIVITGEFLHVRMRRRVLYDAAVSDSELPPGVSRQEVLRWGSAHKARSK